jgi:hypothetical protein
VAALSEKHLTERTETMDTYPGKIHSAITAIMAEVGGVEKGRKNVQQGYLFRGIADLYLACQPVMAKHGVHISPHHVISEDVRERQSKNGGLLLHVRQRIEFRLYASDGSWVSCETTGEAMDSGDKASNKAMSAAMKYALIQSFAIPEDDPDIDTENHSPQPQHREAAASPVKHTSGDTQINPLDELAGAIEDLIGSPKAADKLVWCSDMLKRPIAKPTDMTADEITRLLAAAKAGQMPGGPR